MTGEPPDDGVDDLEEPPDELDDDDPLGDTWAEAAKRTPAPLRPRPTVELDGFDVRVTDRDRVLVVTPGIVGDAVQVSAFAGGDAALIRGTHPVGPVAGRASLARHLADAEGDPGARLDWLRMLEVAIAEIERGTPTPWHDGLGDDTASDAAATRAVDLVYAGLDTALVGLRSRLKTQTATALELGLATGRTIDPAFPIAERVDLVVRLSFESSVPQLQRVGRRIADGAGLDPAELASCWSVIRAGTWESGVRAVVDLVRERRPGTVHLTIDSIQKALGSIRSPSAGDGWGAPVETLLAGIDRIRQETRHPDLSALILDHGKRQETGRDPDTGDDVDTEASWRKLRSYGSQRKDDGYRASSGVGVLERGETPDHYWIRRVSGPLKAPEDAAPGRERIVVVRFDRETGSTTFAEELVVAPRYARTVQAGSDASRIHDELTQHGPQTVPALGELLGKHPETVRKTLARHPDAFREVPGAARPKPWELVPRGLWEVPE